MWILLSWVQDSWRTTVSSKLISSKKVKPVKLPYILCSNYAYIYTMLISKPIDWLPSPRVTYRSGTIQLLNLEKVKNFRKRFVFLLGTSLLGAHSVLVELHERCEYQVGQLFVLFPLRRPGKLGVHYRGDLRTQRSCQSRSFRMMIYLLSLGNLLDRERSFWWCAQIKSEPPRSTPIQCLFWRLVCGAHQLMPNVSATQTISPP